MFSRLGRYRDIILYRIWAQLKSEARQNYLGYLWFALDPLLMTGIFFLVFGVLLNTKSPDYLWFLIIGMIAWQWFEAALNEGMMGLKSKLHILLQIPLPKQLFPLVHVGTATWKFICVLALILLVNVFWGAGASWTWLWIPLIVAVQLTIVAGLAWALSIPVAYNEDTAKISQACTRLLFYLSGIFFAPDLLPEGLRGAFFANPMACLLESYRAVVLRHAAPSLGLLGYAAIWGVGLMVLGWSICKKFDKKLLKEVNL